MNTPEQEFWREADKYARIEVWKSWIAWVSLVLIVASIIYWFCR